MEPLNGTNDIDGLRSTTDWNEGFQDFPQIGHCVELARKAWFRDGNFDVAQIYYGKSIEVLEGSQREILGKELEGVREDFVRCQSSESLRVESYCDYLMRRCDFHGLEKLGVQSQYDLWKISSRDGKAAVAKLLNVLHESWEQFCWDVPVDERACYRDAAYSAELCRYYLTEACLQDALGNGKGARLAMCHYLWRNVMLSLFEAEPLGLGELTGFEVSDKVLFYVVWIARLKGSFQYWDDMIPVLFFLLGRKMGSVDRQLARGVVDDFESCEGLAEYLKQSNLGNSEIVPKILDYELDRKFPKIQTYFAKWLTPPASQSDTKNGNLRWSDKCLLRKSQLEQRLLEMSQSNWLKALADMESGELVVDKFFQPYCINWVCHITNFLGLIEYRKKFKDMNDIRQLCSYFEGHFLIGMPTLEATDVIYPVFKRVTAKVENGFATASVVPAEVRIEHVAGPQYYAEDGVIPFKVRLKLCDVGRPGIRDVEMALIGQCQHRKFEIASGSIEGGDAYPFNFELPEPEAFVEDGHGILRIRLTWVNDSEAAETVAREFVLDYSLAESGFVKIDNPYRDFERAPAAGKLFVGRDQLLNEIVDVFKRDDGGQCYVLYGQRRSGKTSVLNNLEKALDPNRYSYCKTSFGKMTFSGDILDEFSRRLQTAMVKRFGDGARLPNGSGDCMDRLEHMASYVKQRASENSGCGAVWVVGIDEFTYIYDIYYKADCEGHKENVKNFLRALKALLEEKMFHLLLIGRESFVQLQEKFPNELAVLHPTRLSYLEDEDVKKLVDDPLKMQDKNGALQTRYRENALKMVIGLTGGQPWFTQRFCKSMVDYMNDNKIPDITQKVVETIERQMCGGKNNICSNDLHPFFEGMDSEKDRELVVKLCYEMVEKTGSWDSWLSFDEISEELRPLIYVLEKQGLFKTNCGRIAFRMGLLSSWLRANPHHVLQDFIEV